MNKLIKNIKFSHIIFIIVIFIIIIIIFYFAYTAISRYYHIQYLESIEKTIIVIRHGEKANPAKGEMSCKGLNRALILSQVLINRYSKNNGKDIKSIYAPQPIYIRDPTDDDVNSWYLRPIFTIDPLAIKLQIPINIRYNYKEEYELKRLAQRICSEPPGVYVCAWEHHSIPPLVKEILICLNVSKNVPDWDDMDFERMYIIRQFKNGNITFGTEHENLGFLLSNECNF